MPRPTRTTICTATLPNGTACRAWSTRDSTPPLCAAHLHRNTGAGAPTANTNRVSHSFYSRFLTADELADLLPAAADNTLDDEIALARVCCRRILEYLQVTTTTEPADFATLAAVALTGTRTIARLLRERKIISGTAADELAGSLEKILRQVGEHLGAGLMPGDLDP